MKEGEEVKCPWCGSQTTIHNGRLARHLSDGSGKPIQCVGAGMEKIHVEQLRNAQGKTEGAKLLEKFKKKG